MASLFIRPVLDADEVQVVESYRATRALIESDDVELFYVAVPIARRWSASLTQDDRRQFTERATSATLAMLAEILIASEQRGPMMARPMTDAELEEVRRKGPTNG